MAIIHRRATRIAPLQIRTCGTSELELFIAVGTGINSPPPARIRTGPIKTYGSYLEWVTRNR